MSWWPKYFVIRYKVKILFLGLLCLARHRLRPHRRGLSLPVLRTKGFLGGIQCAFHFLTKGRRIKRLTAYPTVNKIKANHFIPLADQKVLKLDGRLRADAPALTASGAFGHIVVECPPRVVIIKTQCRGRTIFHTGQTAVAVFINFKIGHRHHRIIQTPKKTP